MKPEHPQKEHIPALRKLWQEAFGDTDAFLDGFFSTAFAPQRCLCVCRGEEVLSAAYWLDGLLPEGKGAYIYAVATLQAHRGQGLAGMIMKNIHEILSREGYVAAILVPGEPSLANFYGDMGYQFFGGIREYSALAKSPGVNLRRIGAEEYGFLRRRYLPERGVIQEGESLAFLESYADLYAGDDFILAAYQEKDTLSGLELLGNGEKSPQILYTLGAKQGTFRMPGEEDFAMWLPLKAVSKPAYFGLAFD
jgi:GNAT superfamily N-acetyltransferase